MIISHYIKSQYKVPSVALKSIKTIYAYKVSSIAMRVSQVYSRDLHIRVAGYVFKLGGLPRHRIVTLCSYAIQTISAIYLSM